MAKRNPKYRRGERIFRLLTRKKSPLNISDLSTAERLELIFGQSSGIRELLEYAEGDLVNLIGKDLRDLEAMPGVGPALAAKLAAFMFEAGLLCSKIRKTA